MRFDRWPRAVIGFACVAVTVATGPEPAAGRARVEVRSEPPADLRAGETWYLDLFVHASAKEIAASDPPTVLIHDEADDDGSGWRKIRATPVPGNPGAYSAAVVFPRAGTWTYHVHDPIVGGGYEFEPVVIAAPAESSSPSTLGLVLGLAAVAGAAAAFVARLRGHPQGA